MRKLANRARGWWPGPCPLLVAAALTLGAAAASEPPAVIVEPGLTIAAVLPRGVRVTAVGRPGESWAALAMRLTGTTANGPAVRGRRGIEPRPGRPVEIPFALLTPELQAEALAALLPRDHCDSENWVHRPRAGSPIDGSYELLATWFSADDAARAKLEQGLREAGRLATGPLLLPRAAIAEWIARARCPKPAANERVADLLLAADAVRPPRPSASGPSPVDLLAVPPARKVATTVPAVRPATPPLRDFLLPEPTPVHLDYGRDADGAYAVYRLAKGEAIYSAVGLRLTGRVHATELNEAVAAIAKRSGVKEFSGLPIGFAIKIPLELLATEYLPSSDPRRIDYEHDEREIAAFRNDEPVPNLAGVLVILDAGHGGHDRGAASNGVWEADYVYDITSRIKRELETQTLARVVTTVENATIHHRVSDHDRLAARLDTSVMTTPPYLLRESTMGVNLRWYLANSLYRQAIAHGTEPTHVVFLSVHADSLHPTVRGAMVYVPGANYTDGRDGRSDGDYGRFREVRDRPVVSHTEFERKRAEGLSRLLARRLLEAIGRRGLAIHEQKPIRGSVLRNDGEWLPAVLRANQVPVRLLLEVCNLNHPDDNALLTTAAFRQQVAEAYVAALLSYFGNDEAATLARR